MSGTLDRGLQVATLPVDIFEKDNNLVVRAAVPGIEPKDLDVSIEQNILTIRGETRSHFETDEKDTKVYRREVSYGAFSRSIRLPETLSFDKADAEFKNGFVTITIPKPEQQQAQPRKLNVRSTEGTANVPVEGQTPIDKASVK
jgi:HSP20 family protein